VTLTLPQYLEYYWTYLLVILSYDDNDNDNDKPIKSLLKGKGLLPPVGLARLDLFRPSYSHKIQEVLGRTNRIFSSHFMLII
jgi:hypothetical protein